MKPRALFQRPVRIGLALAADCLTAVWLNRGGAVLAGRYPDLSAALSELKTALGNKRAEVSVALLPSLVQLKRLDLPRLSRDELERVLARDAGRYFLEGGGRKVIGVSRLPSEGRTQRGVLAAAGDGELVEQVHRQIRELGWSVGRVVPAHSAWAACAARAWGSPQGKGYVAVLGTASLDLIQVQGPAVLLVRRLPGDGSALEIAAELAGLIRQSSYEPNQPLVLLGEPRLRDGLRDALQTQGIATLRAERHLLPGTEPDAVAAACAHSGGIELIPEPVTREQRRRVRLLTRRALAASVGFLLAAAALEGWGLQRELDQVAARRAELRNRVAQAMTVRSAVEDLMGRLRVLDVAAQNTRSWSAMLGTVAAALPKDAHLVGWHATADSLRIEGQANRATGVFESLQRAPGVGGVRAEAPIQQEVRDSGPPIERFLLGARLQ